MVLFLAMLLLLLPEAACGASRQRPTASPTDSLTKKEKIALELIESVNQLSRTASQLSETALELITRDSKTTTEQKETTITSAYDSGIRRTTPKSAGNIPEIVVPGFTEEDEENMEEYFGDTPRRFPFLTPQSEPEGEGSYLWVPDSLAGIVESILSGHYRDIPASTDDKDYTRPQVERKLSSGMPAQQRVLFRGDTLNMVLHDRNFGRFDRKLFNYLAIPRGIWKFSLTASYGELSTSDMEVLDLMSDINIGGSIFSIKPAISYFITDNMALGLRFTYSNGKANVDGFSVDIDEDMNFSLSDISYNSESYMAGLTLTRYLGLTPRSRFHLTNEVELAFASGNTDFRRPFNSKEKLTHTTTMSAALTYSPGVSVKIMNNVSFDLSFGVFGFSLKSERQSIDGVKSGTRTTSGANFRFNIFNLNFGIGVQL